MWAYAQTGIRLPHYTGDVVRIAPITPTATPSTTSVFGPDTCSTAVQKPRNTAPASLPDTGWTEAHTVTTTRFPVYALRTTSSALV